MRTTLVFMAAGFGTRFGGGVKQIEPVGPNGEVLMDYALHDALQAGFDKVIFIIRKDLETIFRAGVGKRAEAKCDVEYAFQDVSDLPAGFSLPEGRVKPWGTGQAVLACRELIHEPFCVLNADDYYGPWAFRKIHKYIACPEFESGEQKLCMAGYVLGNTLSESGAVTRGLCKVNEDGRLVSIEETKGIEVGYRGAPCVRKEDGVRLLDAQQTVSMNIWGLPSCFMGYLEENFVPFLKNVPAGDLTAEYLLPTLVGNMIARGEGSVRVLPTSDKWFGMTYAEDAIQARQKIMEKIAAGAYPEKL